MKKNKLIVSGKKLRQNGYSFREIGEILHISKSTASLWLRKEQMTESGRKRFDNFIQSANARGVKILADKKQKYLEKLASDCSVLRDQKKYSRNDLKIFLALLYWGEGSKTSKRLAFANSDPELIKTYLRLLRGAFDIKEDKLLAWLHLHDYHSRPEMLTFWSEVTKINKNKINIYNKKNTGIRKKLGYNGCISINYYNYQIFDEVMLIIERFKKFR